MLIGSTQSGPQLAGPMGQSALELSVADPSPGADFGDVLPQAVQPPASAEVLAEFAPVPAAETDLLLVKIEPPKFEPAPTSLPLASTPLSSDESRVVLALNEAIPDVNDRQETPSKKDTTPKPLHDQTADATQVSAGDNTPTSSPPSPGSVGNTKQADATFANNSPIIYPAAAISAGLEGTALLRVRIAADGRVTNIEVLESSGHTVLDKAAVAGVAQWRAHPARSGGQAIESVIRLPIKFQLH